MCMVFNREWLRRTNFAQNLWEPDIYFLFTQWIRWYYPHIINKEMNAQRNRRSFLRPIS